MTDDQYMIRVKLQEQNQKALEKAEEKDLDWSEMGI